MRRICNLPIFIILRDNIVLGFISRRAEGLTKPKVLMLIIIGD